MKPERIEVIYKELESLVIELDRDPGARGPSYLQDLISKTRGFLNKTSLFIMEVHREHHTLESEHTALKAAYDVSSDELLANDRRVTMLPNIDDRKAMINMILREDRTKILELERQIRELGFVEKAVKHRHKELDNTMSAIRMQKSLMDTEVRTGSFYGDETDSSRSRKPSPPITEAFEDTELMKLLESATPSAGPKPEIDEVALLTGEISAEELFNAVPAAQASTPAAQAEPQPIVESAPEEPKTSEPEASEDVRDMRKFLDGDDYSDLLDSV